MILASKFGRRRDVAYHLGCSLGEKVRQQKYGEVIDAVVAVPIGRSRLLKRHYNQAEEIAAAVSAKIGKPMLWNALAKVKETKPQAMLQVSERLKNPSGAYRAVDKRVVFGKTILLVDDVLTTGATASECAVELRKAGCKAVVLGTIARDIIEA
jgi:ComF family protein